MNVEEKESPVWWCAGSPSQLALTTDIARVVKDQTVKHCQPCPKEDWYIHGTLGQHC